VLGLIYAPTQSGWSLSASMLSWAFPMALFIVVATVLYLQISQPPRPVPGHKDLVPALAGPPDHGTARAMSAAAGMSTAAGGGAAPLAAEPHGAPGAADAAAAEAGDAPGSPGRPAPAGDEQPAPGEQPGPDPAGPEASE
jgi:hypothetical protein